MPTSTSTHSQGGPLVVDVQGLPPHLIVLLVWRSPRPCTGTVGPLLFSQLVAAGQKRAS